MVDEAPRLMVLSIIRSCGTSAFSHGLPWCTHNAYGNSSRWPLVQASR